MSPENHGVSAGPIQLLFASTCTAVQDAAIGSRLLPQHRIEFIGEVISAIKLDDAIGGPDAIGQYLIRLHPATTRMVLSGLGKRSVDPDDYVLRSHRGYVSAFLKREHAAPTLAVDVVVYTREAYLKDPDVQQDERELHRVQHSSATHILVGVLAHGASESELSPFRFVHNLAGGNNAYLPENLTVEDIVAEAQSVMRHASEWSVVAD